MLTIKNFDVLKARTLVISFYLNYQLIEAFEYVSPVRGERMYVFKLAAASSDYKNVSFTLYRDIDKKDGGYRLYNSISGDYIIVTKRGLSDMRTFTDILKDELNSIC